MSADGRTERLHRPPAQVKNIYIMINSCKSTKSINSFEFVAIPSPRDVFRKYGERINTSGEFTTSGNNYTSPALVNSSSTIDSMINAQKMLEKEIATGNLNK